MERILVYGAGGHAKGVIDAIEKSREYKIVGVLDDRATLHRTSYYGYTVIGGSEKLKCNTYKNCKVIVAIARNDIRERLFMKLHSLGHQFGSVIHPSAQLARDVSIHSGTMIMANAVINPGTKIGTSVVINTGAIVEHDCIINDFAHIGPGAHLAGAVVIGTRAFVGLGASVIEFRQIGDTSTIGAGSVVINDIPDHVTAIGVPAKVLKTGVTL